MTHLKQKRKLLKRKKIRNIVLNIVCITIGVYGLFWIFGYFWHHVKYEITNDAFVDQYVAPINVRVAGYIKEIRFHEHQFVHKGDTLIILDDSEYLIRQKEAKASLVDALGSREIVNSNIEASYNKIAGQEASINEAKAKLWQLEQDYLRYRRLLEEESVPRQQFEQVKSDYDAAMARVEALEVQKKVIQFQHSEARKKTTVADAAILRAEAAFDLAKLNLSYTVITAPYDGYIGRRTLEIGQYVPAGQTVSFLVRRNDKWVTANYRETQISNIYIGQKVYIYVDGIKNRRFEGHVSAISEATGSKYSLVPVDNSSGNFVKVQQRIPVRIEFDSLRAEDFELLRAGMMVETEAVRL